MFVIVLVIMHAYFHIIISYQVTLFEISGGKVKASKPI